MTGGEVLAVAGFIVALVGALGTIWWRVYTMITSNRTELAGQIGAATAVAQLARQELADHRLHTAEVYVTKAGMSEQTAQIMRAIEGLGSRIDGIHERLDGWSRPPSRSRAS